MAKHREKQLLSETNPELLDWWDSEKNDPSLLNTLSPRARKECWWKCPEGHSFKLAVYAMRDLNWACNECFAIKGREYERWKQTSVAAVPELLVAWRDEHDPNQITVAGGGLYKFECPKGHFPRISPYTFMRSGCPHCRGQRDDKRWISVHAPEIARQWHPTKNKLTPAEVDIHSRRKCWWKSECCRWEWEAMAVSRTHARSLLCPQCKTVTGSLAWQLPELAAEWSPANELSPLHVKPFSAGTFEWICSVNTQHVWNAALASRSGGAACPQCSVVGKSRIEMDHFRAASAIYLNAQSGRRLASPAFTGPGSWATDISIDLDGALLIIEYDGIYWHSSEARREVDVRKSLDLLRAGYLLVRLREDGLVSLGIEHQNYSEFTVYSAAPRPTEALASVRKWVEKRTLLRQAEQLDEDLRVPR